MAMGSYLSVSFSPRHFQPRIGFRTSLASPRLNSPRSSAHGELCEEPKEFGGVGRIVVQDSGGPFGPHLHGVFEAHLAWMQDGFVRGLRNQQAVQFVGHP